MSVVDINTASLHAIPSHAAGIISDSQLPSLCQLSLLLLQPHISIVCSNQASTLCTGVVQQQLQNVIHCCCLTPHCCSQPSAKCNAAATAVCPTHLQVAAMLSWRPSCRPLCSSCWAHSTVGAVHCGASWRQYSCQQQRQLMPGRCCWQLQCRWRETASCQVSADCMRG